MTPAPMKVINSLAAKGSKTGSIGFVGTFAAGSDYNAEDDGNGLPGAHSRSGPTFTFVNAALSDVHLAPTDTGARDFGLSNPLPGWFTDDIDGLPRSGAWDIGADEAGIAPPDTNPPSMPTGLSATTVSSSQINLAWTASTDDVAVTGYTIFRNGSPIGTSGTTSFSDTGLAASTTYTYAVSAYDAAGNNSPTSPPATATTSPPSFDFALSNGGNRSVARGSSVDNAITATLVSGATQTVVFSTSGLPAGATASYAPSSCSPGCATTITIATTAATPLATSTITVTGTAGSLVRTTTFSLTVTSPGDTTAPTVALGASPANGSTVRATRDPERDGLRQRRRRRRAVPPRRRESRRGRHDLAVLPQLEYHDGQQRTACPVGSSPRRRRQYHGGDRRQCHRRQSAADGHHRDQRRRRGHELEDRDVDARRDRQCGPRVADAVFEFDERLLDGGNVRDDQDLDLDVGRRHQDRVRAIPRRRRQLVVGRDHGHDRPGHHRAHDLIASRTPA